MDIRHDSSSNIPIHCSDPIALTARKTVTMIVESSISVKIEKKRGTARKFIYDENVYVNVYFDSSARQSSDDKEESFSYATQNGCEYGTN